MNKMKSFSAWGLLALLIMSAVFTSCKEDDPEIQEAFITEFAITNTGAEGTTRADGVINNLTILVNVPFETNVTALIPDIKISPGATVIPASGTALDFSQPRNFVVTNGDKTNTYQVTVEKDDPTSGVILSISFKSATSGEVYQTDVNQTDKKITVTFNELQSKILEINEITVLPAGTTYVLSSGTDELDLSAAQSITLSYAGTQTIYSIEANITEAGFSPGKTATLMNRSSSAGAVPSLLDDNLSRGAAFNGRYVITPSRKDENQVLVWDVENPTANPANLNLGGVVSGGTWIVSDARTVENHIYVSNMVMSEGGVFKVYRWEGIEDATPEVVIEYTVTGPVGSASTVRIGDAISVIGNPKTNGYIMASNFPFQNPQNQFYVWKFENGVASGPEVWNVTPLEGLRIGQYGRITEIPGVTDKFMVSGAEMGIAVIDNQGTVLYELPDALIQYRAYDPTVFEFNGGRYLSYTVNREWDPSGTFYQIVNITEGSDIVEALKALNDDNIAQRKVYTKVFGTIADVWISATNNVGFSSTGKPRVLGFSVLNGFIVEELDR